MKNRHKIIALMLTLAMSSCTEEYFVESEPAVKTVDLTNYDFLNSNPDDFGELVKVIDRTGRKSLINQSNVTLFALQDASILTYLGSQDYESVEEANLGHLDSLLQKYIILDSRLLRGDIQLGLGNDLVTSNALKMNVKTIKGEYKGVQNVGAVNIIYTDSGLLASLKAQKLNTSSAETLVSTGDISTTNGVIHVINKGHRFGF